jgi:putative redox protein
MRSARVKWVEGMQFIGIAPSGHAIPLDTHEAVGGTDSAARPAELTLVSLGGCTAMDVVSILRKMRVPFEDFEVEVRADAAEEHPKVFTRIEIVYRITGDVPEDKLVKAINLSQERYCSISAMMRKAVPLTFRHEIVRTKEKEASR